MALPHSQSGDIVDVRPLGTRLAGANTNAILKAEQLELVRVVLPAGRELKQHLVPGEITVQCLEGRVRLEAHSRNMTLAPGDLVYLAGGEPHALRAIEDTSLLLTIALVRE